jgi:hypothetical protein
MSEDPVQLTLTRHEAFVLVAWLFNFDQTELAPPLDSAERSVLWRLEGKLEEQLFEVLAPNYRELLDEARKKVLAMGPGGTPPAPLRPE